MDKKNEVIKYMIDESFGKHPVLTNIVTGITMGLVVKGLLKGARYLIWGDQSSGDDD